jgi:hypothetical protein
MKRLEMRRGSTLAVCMCMMMVMSLLGLALASSSINSARLSNHRRDVETAFSIADAGLNHALYSLRENKNYSNQSWTSFGEGDFKVNITSETPNFNRKLVVSTGRVRSLGGKYLERSVQAKVDFESLVWDYGIIAKQTLAVSGSSIIDSAPIANQGNIHSNGSVTTGGSSEVRGTATATGTVTNGGYISGGTQSGVAEVPFPEIDTASLLTEATALGVTIGSISVNSGSVTLRGKLVGDLTVGSTGQVNIDGLLWVTGNVQLKGQSYTGNGTLIASGTVALAGGSGFTGAETNNLAIVTLSSANPALTITGNSTVRGGLYVPNGGTTVEGNTRIVGTLASNTVNMTGSAHFTRPTDYIAPWQLADKPRVLFWQEL